MRFLVLFVLVMGCDHPQRDMPSSTRDAATVTHTAAFTGVIKAEPKLTICERACSNLCVMFECPEESGISHETLGYPPCVRRCNVGTISWKPECAAKAHTTEEAEACGVKWAHSPDAIHTEVP